MRTSRLDKNEDEKDTVDFFVGIRWPRGPRCLYCESRNVKLMPRRAIFHCTDCRKQFAVLKETRFDGMRLLPSQLFKVLTLYYTKGGELTVREIQHILGSTKKTAAYSSAYRLSRKLKNIKMDWNNEPKFNDFVWKAISRSI